MKGIEGLVRCHVRCWMESGRDCRGGWNGRDRRVCLLGVGGTRGDREGLVKVGGRLFGACCGRGR